MGEQYDMVFIADIRKRTVIKQYGANWGGSPAHEEVFYHRKICLPLTYLLNSEGVIVWKYVGTKTDRPDIDALLDAIDRHIPQ